jgi:poly-gamma-glutamate capsule biosynthesis protein CapA/YwtB (metallophosphatase superfamily)
VERGKKILRFAAPAFLLLLLTLAAHMLMRPQKRPVRIGVDSPSPALGVEIFKNFDSAVEIVPLAQAAGLATGELDYFLTAEESLSSKGQTAGHVVAAVGVNFFHPRQDISLDELTTLLSDSPEQVLISDELALACFPWGDRGKFLPTEKVVAAVGNESVLGIVPVHKRRPCLKVLPVDGIDPRGEEVLASRYPLMARLQIYRRPPTFRERLQKIPGKEQDLLAAYLLSEANPWRNPLRPQSRFAAVGDVMLDRDVKKAALAHNWQWIFAETAPLLRSMDLAFCNLECPIGSKGKFINMFQAPPEAVEGLVYAGFDVVSLANNHILDYHHEGMLETMEILTENNIAGVGAGSNLEAARQPVILEVQGIRIGFVSYTEMWFVHAREPISWQATSDEPGVVPALPEYIWEDISALRDEADIVIASFHWGKEYASQPAAEQKALARLAVDAGTDLVLGHHPHVLQGIEFYKHGVIAYSLGNFVFDQRLPGTQESMVLEATLSKQGVLDINLHPASIQNMRPVILEGRSKNYLLNRIAELSLAIE